MTDNLNVHPLCIHLLTLTCNSLFMDSLTIPWPEKYDIAGHRDGPLGSERGGRGQVPSNSSGCLRPAMEPPYPARLFSDPGPLRCYVWVVSLPFCEVTTAP